MKRLALVIALLTATSACAVQQDNEKKDSNSFLIKCGKDAAIMGALYYAPYTTSAAIIANTWLRSRTAEKQQPNGGGHSGGGNGGGGVTGWRK